MKTYKAIWSYNQSCLRKGQEVARCEAVSADEFASQLCTTYAFGLGDGFSFARYESEEQIHESYGDDWPEWAESITAYPVLVFTSNFGDEILCNPSTAQIIDQIECESYGDYDLTIQERQID